MYTARTSFSHLGDASARGPYAPSMVKRFKGVETFGWNREIFRNSHATVLKLNFWVMTCYLHQTSPASYCNRNCRLLCLSVCDNGYITRNLRPIGNLVWKRGREGRILLRRGWFIKKGGILMVFWNGVLIWEGGGALLDGEGWDSLSNCVKNWNTIVHPSCELQHLNEVFGAVCCFIIACACSLHILHWVGRGSFNNFSITHCFLPNSSFNASTCSFNSSIISFFTDCSSLMTSLMKSIICRSSAVLFFNRESWGVDVALFLFLALPNLMSGSPTFQLSLKRWAQRPDTS